MAGSHRKDDDDVSYVISNRQTTYWDFMGDQGTSRVHFRGKAEGHFSQETVQTFDVVDEHPLLLDYVAPWMSLYVSAAATDAATIVASIGSAVSALVDGWRPASHYLNGSGAALEDGFGLLLQGPQPIVQAVKAVLEHHAVRFSELPLHNPRASRRALIAWPNWLIAGRFWIERR
jgi:hypothetical protein